MSTTDLTEYDRLNTIAEATACGYDGCNGRGHEHQVPPENWWHDVVEDNFDGRSVLATLTVGADGKAIGNLSMEASGDMTAAELRADADVYESYPAWLRILADKLDELNK